MSRRGSSRRLRVAIHEEKLTYIGEILTMKMVDNAEGSYIIKLWMENKLI